MKHVVNKYTGKLSLGYKYYSIDEIILMFCILLLFDIPTYIAESGSYLIIIACFIDYLLTFNNIKDKISNFDFLLYIGIGLIAYNSDNEYITGLIMSIYIYYLIETSLVPKKDNIIVEAKNEEQK